MTVYIIAQINIDNRERYSQYEAGFMDIFSQYGGTVLSIDEAPSVLEGDWGCTRTVLLEFPSNEEALAWYESAEYQELAKHRFLASSANIAILKDLS